MAELPDQFRAQATFHDNDGVLGEMTIAPLNDLTQEKYEIHERVKTGVVITKIEMGSTAEQAGLSPGDVILEINRYDVSTVEDFEKIYRKSKEKLLLLVYRKGHSYYLVLR